MFFNAFKLNLRNPIGFKLNIKVIIERSVLIESSKAATEEVLDRLRNQVSAINELIKSL